MLRNFWVGKSFRTHFPSLKNLHIAETCLAVFLAKAWRTNHRRKRGFFAMACCA